MEISMDQPADSGEEYSRAWEVPDRAPSVEQELVARSRAELILKAIHALPEKQRAAVLLHKYQELDYDEIARVLECSESALKSLLFRAYETLRVELAPLVNRPLENNSVRV
jgi:RNA polymerase sigma-70 factor, ECF subfamily